VAREKTFNPPSLRSYGEAGNQHSMLNIEFARASQPHWALNVECSLLNVLFLVLI
jgi:hypothetical protein